MTAHGISKGVSRQAKHRVGAGWAVRVTLSVACLMALPGANAPAATGSGWSVWRLPVPSSAEAFPLSCSSDAACTAVATYFPFPSSDRDVLFALRWNGDGWSREVMAEPAGSSTVLVSGISCPSLSSCVAVGGSTTGVRAGPYVPLVERWNGAVWSVERVPAPAGPGLSSQLSSVSCASPVACTAVGGSVSRNPRRPAAALVERWNGAAWSIQRAPGGPLSSVSCASSVACTAVGNSTNETRAEGWEGGRWSIEPNPHPRGFNGPDGHNDVGSVSCASADACIAVGDSGWGTGFNSVRVTLAERWNGSQWSVQPTPNPIQQDELNGVSCTSRGLCTAVGDYTDRAGDATLPLVERWHGASWSVLRTPRRLSRGRSADSTLQDVVCFTNGNCIAIGDAEGGPFAVEFPSTA